MAQVYVSSLLRGLCHGASLIEVPDGTLDEVLHGVDARCPGFYGRVVDEGRLRPELVLAHP